VITHSSCWFHKSTYSQGRECSLQADCGYMSYPCMMWLNTTVLSPFSVVLYCMHNRTQVLWCGEKPLLRKEPLHTRYDRIGVYRVADAWNAREKVAGRHTQTTWVPAIKQGVTHVPTTHTHQASYTDYIKQTPMVSALFVSLPRWWRCSAPDSCYALLSFCFPDALIVPDLRTHPRSARHARFKRHPPHTP